jgi:hypothetical protein
VGNTKLCSCKRIKLKGEMKHVENMRQKKTYGHPKGVDRPYGTITTSKGCVWDNKSKCRMFFCCMCPIKSKKSEKSRKISQNIASCPEVI